MRHFRGNEDQKKKGEWQKGGGGSSVGAEKVPEASGRTNREELEWRRRF